MRIGTHTGYDRITIEFKNGQPTSVEIKPQGNTTFTQDASGQKFVLLGSMVQTVWIAPGDAVAVESPALGRVSARFV